MSLPEVGSRAAAERLLAGGDVLVDGALPVRRAIGSRAARELSLEPPERPPTELEPEAMDLQIAYEDEHLLVVDKPAGLVVHPAAGHSTGTLVHGLLAHSAAGGEPERPGIVHRLDRDTSGLLVVARSPEAHRRLQELVRRRALERGYAALVLGRPRCNAAGSRRRSAATATTRSATRSTPTRRARRRRTSSCARRCPAARSSPSASRPAGRTRSASTSPRSTCRSPGDAVYGRAGDLGLERQFLHAERLAFPHPFTDEPVETNSPSRRISPPPWSAPAWSAPS